MCMCTCGRKHMCVQYAHTHMCACMYVSFYSTEDNLLRTPVVEKQMYFPLQDYPVNNMVTGNLTLRVNPGKGREVGQGAGSAAIVCQVLSLQSLSPL